MKFRNILVLLMVLLVVDLAYAKDVVESVHTAQAIFNRIGIASLSIGITLGGILFSLGFGNFGRIVLMSGVAGALCILGGPAAIGLLGKIFGISI